MPQLFTRRANTLPLVSLAAVGLLALAVTVGIWYWFSPKFYEIGYQPEQPVPYSHRLHAGQLGMDCRYCHSQVEDSPHANVPPTQTCMNCHSQIQTDSEKLLPVRESWATGEPIQWVNVHHIADYARFPHAPHLNVGGGLAIGCETCHGRIDQMEVVQVVAPLSMGWCLDCHRDPAPNLRPASQITTMGLYAQETDDDHADRVARNREAITAEGVSIRPPQNCSACHY
jgi:Cytochrome c7 and related cytochrome c